MTNMTGSKLSIFSHPGTKIPEVPCTRRTIMGFVYETSLIWVIIMGVKLWLVYFRSLHICKNYHSYAKYMINSYTSYNIVIVKENNRLLDYYKIISISRSILPGPIWASTSSQANMGVSFLDVGSM
jgi:hypothetical protein